MKFFGALASSLAFLLPSVFAGNVCNPGELAVGVVQLCFTYGGDNTGCDAATGAIWDHDCNSVAETSNDGYCNGGWDSGVVLNCATNGWVDYIGYNGQAYGYCYQSNDPEGTCGRALDGYTDYYYCCPTE